MDHLVISPSPSPSPPDGSSKGECLPISPRARQALILSDKLLSVDNNNMAAEWEIV